MKYLILKNIYKITKYFKCWRNYGTRGALVFKGENETWIVSRNMAQEGAGLALSLCVRVK